MLLWSLISLLTIFTELIQEDKQLLCDVTPSIYQKNWQVDGTNNDDSMVDLGDLEWEDLDHSNAGREYEAFHDLSEEMYTVTGKYTSSYGLQCGSLPLRLMADVVSTIIHVMNACMMQQLDAAWMDQYPAIVSAYLHWDSDGVPPDMMGPGDDVVTILCVDLFGEPGILFSN